MLRVFILGIFAFVGVAGVEAIRGGLVLMLLLFGGAVLCALAAIVADR